MKEWLILEVIYRFILLLFIIYLVLLSEYILTNIKSHQKVMIQVNQSINENQYVIMKIKESLDEFDYECYYE